MVNETLEQQQQHFKSVNGIPANINQCGWAGRFIDILWWVWIEAYQWFPTVQRSYSPWRYCGLHKVYPSIHPGSTIDLPIKIELSITRSGRRRWGSKKMICGIFSICLYLQSLCLCFGSINVTVILRTITEYEIITRRLNERIP